MSDVLRATAGDRRREALRRLERMIPAPVRRDLAIRRARELAREVRR